LITTYILNTKAIENQYHENKLFAKRGVKVGNQRCFIG